MVTAMVLQRRRSLSLEFHGVGQLITRIRYSRIIRILVGADLFFDTPNYRPDLRLRIEFGR